MADEGAPAEQSAADEELPQPNEAEIQQDAESFEDALDEVPAVDRPASRSLTQRRQSSSSTYTLKRTISESPSLPSNLQNGHHKNGVTDSASMVDIRPPKSPLLTSHRISTSSLDDINLEDSTLEEPSSSSRLSTGTVKKPPSPTKTGATAKPPLSQTLHGLSSPLPSVPWGAPPQAPAAKISTAIPASTSRKLTSPFSWLSRSTPSVPKEVPQSSSPTQYPRRNTASSVATISSNPELMLSKIEDRFESDIPPKDAPKRALRNSLQDRFKILRMREEAGISPTGEDISGSTPAERGSYASLISATIGLSSPSSPSDNYEKGLHAQDSSKHAPKSPLLPSVNPNLAPGTVSGASAGPSSMNDSSIGVDWDLWQSVVSDGPAVVARTSAEELNRAISSGIPSAIRGVIWQVLAQSKNAHLERVYRELLARGRNTSDVDRSSGSVSLPPTPSERSAKEAEPTSSSSSVRSSSSTSPVSQSASREREFDNVAKMEAAALAKGKKMTADDELALQRLEKAIKRDLGGRTSYSKYAASAGLQDGLLGVCKAYALFDEAVGYAQGMNFLIMPLLFNMPEEEAFCLLVRLMNQYHLREMFIQDMPGLHLHLYQFERLLEDLEPALYCHLHRRGVTPQLYATQWFLTLFAYRFPLQLVLRIFDLLLSEGLEGAILKFGIVLMQKNAATLLTLSDMSTLTTFLKDRLFDVYIDQTPSAHSILESGFFGNSGGTDKEVYRADVMVRDACAVKITPEMLESYRGEWEEKMRMEKERELEIDALKGSNASLSAKVRSLEERAEKFDTEHVQVASQLVRTKVENEELRDENESLKGQVSELRTVVEKQPEEIEAKLTGEMNRIMARNMEVHSTNQELETQLEEMERQLIVAKMQYAEINSEHESLKQRWTDLRKALGD
ncbi:MAG: GTPase-activating protein [Trizodia sp. TS-e1964]|nr:MAG: GTPase-activating protein [Trizodia sp. TS-e1964]